MFDEFGNFNFDDLFNTPIPNTPSFDEFLGGNSSTSLLPNSSSSKEVIELISNNDLASFDFVALSVSVVSLLIIVLFVLIALRVFLVSIDFFKS